MINKSSSNVSSNVSNFYIFSNVLSHYSIFYLIGMQLVGRNYYNPAKAISIPKHKLVAIFLLLFINFNLISYE